MNERIIDFHTHPFEKAENDICYYKRHLGVKADEIRPFMEKLGISCICGSVINSIRLESITWQDIERLNNEALELAEKMDGFYVPGFHIHPDFLQESLAEMERMHTLGVNLIGEIVPYFHGWSDYGCDAMDKILDRALELNMIFNFHTMNDDSIDRMVEKHPDNIIIAAHPGEFDSFGRHLQRMEKSKNYYLDLSGTGIFRQGMLAYGIKLFGAERFIFGSDFPVCNPAVYVGGVGLDSLISDEDKEAVMWKNADRLLEATENNFYKIHKKNYK